MQEELDNFKIINYRTSFDNKIMSKEIYTKGMNSRIIYSKYDTIALKSENEYENIVPSAEIPNKAFRAVFNFILAKEIKGRTSVVFQIKDANDSIISWQNLKMEKAQHYQMYFNYQGFPEAKTPLFLSIYFWNQDKERIFVKDIDVLLREM